MALSYLSSDWVFYVLHPIILMQHTDDGFPKFKLSCAGSPQVDARCDGAKHKWKVGKLDGLLQGAHCCHDGFAMQGESASR